ncbi:hypothetical protein NDU88_006455 [Pleurodeles waltl]|uniref:Uncharacterized protein n=1 Tax=Pleurodeles waltl TaxID=8319 RepID=A0AAV7RPK9_PLEWA|nr:hypothetical protein NDU88_006455 [Pleurodeles waltl]
MCRTLINKLRPGPENILHKHTQEELYMQREPSAKSRIDEGHKPSLPAGVRDEGLLTATEEEREADTWITPRLKRRRRKPTKTRPNQEQVAAERDQAEAAAIRCCKNPFDTLRSEHAQISGSDSGSEISETGSNKAPHIMPGSVDDTI